PYIDNLVNLLVADDLGGVPKEEVLRVLAPLGVAWVRSDGGWEKITKPWPGDIDEWTHYLHDASGNAVAKDRVVGPPRRVQWVEGPLWQRHHELNANPNAFVSAKGRIFYICDEAPATVTGLPDQWALVARDAFNGVLLWKRPVPEWGWKAWSLREAGGRFNLPVYIPRRLVAAGDRLYVTLGFNAPLTALDAATGKTIKTYEAAKFTDEIMHQEGVLVLSVNKASQKPGLIRDEAPVKKQVVALKADTGEVLWKQGDYVGISSKADSFERITHLSLAVGPEHVFLVEEDAVVCLDLKTGRELWRTPRGEKKPRRGHIPYNPPNLCTLLAHQDVALFAQPEEPYTRKTWNQGVKCVLTGISAATGKVLWTHPCSKWGPGVKADVFAIGELVWTHAADEYAVIGIDLHSGEVKRKFSTEEAFREVHHHRCFRNKATERYLLTARRGIEFLDLKDEQCQKHHWVRGACRYGILPCNGLVYVPPHPCRCYVDIKISGFHALAAAPEKAAEGSAGAPPLEKGTAYEGIRNPQSAIRNGDDWPTYRHDAARSGSTGADVPVKLARLWQARLGGRLSACTVAGPTVFAAVIDQHRLCALDAGDGSLLWDYTAGGRVDTPPTIYRGLVLFGSADGWVHCLRASDGELAWRFRAAPQERRVVAFGRLESPWPVHGTVLVADGVAYVAAGRSTHLDGGIRVCAIRPDTGQLIRELKTLNAQPHGLEDVLVADGSSVYMRHLEFSLKAGPQPAEPKKGRARRGQPKKAGAGSPVTSRAFSTAGLLDDSWFSRVGWGGGGGKSGGAELLVFNDQSTFAIRTRRKGGFGGWFQPASGAYELVAFDKGGK
ncbi:MAG: PQQ-binding-like beta-propeller repeat protein, partial [Phycisphaerae bacterium]